MEINDYDNNHGARQTSVYVPNDLWLSAKHNFIELRSAMIFGIKFLLAEKDVMDHPENSLTEKIKKVHQKLQEKCNELETLKNPESIKIDAEAEADAILGGIINGKPK